MNEKRPLAAAIHLPFVKAIGRDEAAPSLHRGTEGWLLKDRFAARINQQREGPRILHPGRQQAPSHQGELAFAAGQTNDGYRLRGGDIVTRREIGLSSSQPNSVRIAFG